MTVNAETTRLERLKGALVDWLLRTTFPGLPNIFRVTHCTIRVVWTLAYLTSFAFCCYYVAKCFVEYTKYATTVSIANVRETPTNFPAVTLCNLNPINEFAPATETHLSSFYPMVYDKMNCQFGRESGKYVTISNWMSCFNITSEVKLIQIMLRVFRSSLLSNYNLSEWAQFGYTDESLATFNGFGIPSQPTKFVHPSYGNCYTWNDGNNGQVWKTNKVGGGYGLSLELLVGHGKLQSHTGNRKPVF